MQRARYRRCDPASPRRIWPRLVESSFGRLTHARIWSTSGNIFARVASPEIADKLLRDIRTAAERLRDHPFLGWPRNEIANGLRSFLVHPHSIIYRVTETQVDIARILHERRDFAAEFAEDRKP